MGTTGECQRRSQRHLSFAVRQPGVCLNTLSQQTGMARAKKLLLAYGITSNSPVYNIHTSGGRGGAFPIIGIFDKRLLLLYG